MRLSNIRIENFRGIKLLDVALEDITVLIGENNTCKTSLLEALRFALRDVRSRKGCVFDPLDFHLENATSDPTKALPISIRLEFREDANHKFDKTIKQKLIRAKILQTDDNKNALIVFRITGSYNPSIQDFSHHWEFLNKEYEVITNLPDSSLVTFHDTVSYFYLSALRDATKQFDARGPFWRPFLKTVQLTETQKFEIEDKLNDINNIIIQSHTSLSDIVNSLADIQNIIPLSQISSDHVSIEAVPSRIFDILAKTQIHLSTKTGAKIPISRHGEGTQSLAVLKLFQAYLQAWNSGVPIICLEEPEAHLHPSAIRSLWQALKQMPGQMIISTHSGDILSEVPIESITRLHNSNATISAHKLKDANLPEDDQRKFNYKIRRERGSLMFARCWILGEGETEATIIPAFANLLGYDLELHGIRLIGYQEGLSLKTALRVANTLGIKWVVLADNDKQGLDDKETAKKFLNGKKIDDVFFAMKELNIEEYLCLNGFLNLYEDLKDDQKWLTHKVDKNDLSYPIAIAQSFPSKKKTRAAQLIVEYLHEKEKTVVPLLIKQVIEAAVKYANE